MSYAGHVLDMISRIKQNRSLKEARKKRYAKVKEAYQKHLVKHIVAKDKNHLSEAEFELFKRKLKRKFRNERIRATSLTTITTVLIIGLALFYIYYYMQ